MIKKKQIAIAGFWVILIFGFSQLIRLGSSLIVTRLLAPEMFGVMALVYVVLQGVEMFSDLGFWSYIVRHKEGDDPHILNVVWTLQVMRGLALFVIIALLAAALAYGAHVFPNIVNGVYANKDLPILIIIAGATSIITGLKSKAPAVMSRALQRGKLEMMELFSQLLGAFVMVAWAWFYPSIWALVSAGLTSTLTSTLLSYKLFPYRHKLTWDKSIAKDVYHFGKWIVLASTLTYLAQQGDRIFLGGVMSANDLGVYSIAFAMAGILNAVTLNLSSKVIFPTLSSIVHHDRQNLAEKYYRIRAYLDLAVFMAAGIFIALAPLLIDILYDDRYLEAGWMLQILVFSVIGSSMSSTSLECLSALSVTKPNMWVMATRTIALMVSLPLAFNLYGIQGAIWAIAANVWFGLPIVYWNLAKNSVFSWVKELRMLPIIAMGYVIGELIRISFMR